MCKRARPSKELGYAVCGGWGVKSVRAHDALMAGGWFDLTRAGGWFDLREKYYCLLEKSTTAGCHKNRVIINEPALKPPPLRSCTRRGRIYNFWEALGTTVQSRLVLHPNQAQRRSIVCDTDCCTPSARPSSSRQRRSSSRKPKLSTYIVI